MGRAPGRPGTDEAVEVGVVAAATVALGDDLQSPSSQPACDLIWGRVVVVATPAPVVLAHDDRQASGHGFRESPGDLCAVDLLNGDVDEAARAHGPAEVDEHRRPILRGPS